MRVIESLDLTVADDIGAVYLREGLHQPRLSSTRIRQDIIEFRCLSGFRLTQHSTVYTLYASTVPAEQSIEKTRTHILTEGRTWHNPAESTEYRHSIQQQRQSPALSIVSTSNLYNAPSGSHP